MNEHLSLLRTDTRYLALTYGVIDAAARTLALASAAFPFPRLVRDGKLQTVKVSGLPLGLFDNADYQEVLLELRSGDVVVLCSDGLDDCLHQQGKQVSMNGLDTWVRKLAVRSAQEIADELILVSEPATAVLPADDRTVVVLKVT
jgi:sigma-B regulation protein RsbU (phosphoserine phosphatase)